jgi:hypothetical protein
MSTQGNERFDDGGGQGTGTAYAERSYTRPYGGGGGGYSGMYGRGRPSFPIETKPFFLTSEFLFPLLAWFGLLITTLSNDTIDARRFWELTVALLIGYMLSRGIAKSGTKSRSWDPREDPDLLRRRGGGDGGR